MYDIFPKEIWELITSYCDYANRFMMRMFAMRISSS